MTTITYPHTRPAATAVFTALVCASTMMFSIYVPATRGYFNIGEAMVYTTALLFGPLIGAFAGGIGSALADAFLGYWIYVPATLAIKACEGAVVGLLGRRIIKGVSTLKWRAFTFFIAGAIASLLGYTGTHLYTGEVELSLGLSTLGILTIPLTIPATFWIWATLLVAAALIYIGANYNPQVGWTVLSMLVGGLLMVAGYFSYEWALYGAAALIEVPVNIGQATIGAVIATPLVRAVWKRLPHLKGGGV